MGMLIRKLVYFTALYAVLVALMLGPSWEDGKKMAEAASGDIVAWRTSTAEKVRITNASPVPALIPASPRGMDVGTTSYPVRNVKCVNLTMVGTYGSDNINAVNNLTVGNNIVTAGNVVSTGPINTTKTVTVGNLVTSGAGNVGTLTASTSTNTVTETATNSHVALANITQLINGVQAFSSNATIGATSARYVAVDTSGGACTATVNTSATAGSTWIFWDKTGTWDTNNFSVNVTAGANINLVNIYTSTTEHGSIRVTADGAGNYHTW